MTQMSIYAKEGVNNALSAGKNSWSNSAKVDAACLRYTALTRDVNLDARKEDLQELRLIMPNDRPWSVGEIRALPMIIREAARQSGPKTASRLNHLADLAEREGLHGCIALVAAAERVS